MNPGTLSWARIWTKEEVLTATTGKENPIMVHLSLTRLRLRSWRFFPSFAVDAIRSNRQLTRAAGFLNGALLRDRRLTFWTLTAWDNQASMRQYMLSGNHRNAMPKLMRWCDEASVAHWEQPDATLPAWLEADRYMREHGRASKVLHPSPQHAALAYATPGTTFGSPIKPRKDR